MAWADGVIPFWDPFASGGCYNPNRSDLQVSRVCGGISRDVWLAAAIPNLTSWAKNPLKYEMGQTTLPAKLFGAMKGASPVQRGDFLLRHVGWRGYFMGFGNAGEFVNTVGTGLTPGGWLTVIGGLHITDELSR
jgi:hypothetical protein